ncbi:MAG: OmpA family protein [Bacteroidetes bacterium]|nr:OmpA family protein [Bacteroidota bacterium]
MVLTKEYYEVEADIADSIRIEHNKIFEKNRRSENDLEECIRDMEELTVTNLSLDRAYQDILRRYNFLIDQNEEVLSTSSYEKQELTEKLAAQQGELDKKIRELQNLEYSIQQRENQLNGLQARLSESESSLSERNKKINELSTMLYMQEEKMQVIKNNLRQALTSFDNTELTVTERNGKVLVSLSQNLLFKTGSNKVDWKGKKAIRQLADVLKVNPDIEISVEGHTDADGTIENNWDLSVSRATSVVKILTASGVDPKRVLASGRSFYFPISDNETSEGKSKNRRVDIILSPNMNALFQIFDEQ